MPTYADYLGTPPSELMNILLGKIVDEQWGDVHEKIRAEFAKLKADNQLTLLKDNSPYYCLYKHKNVGYIDWGCNF